MTRKNDRKAKPRVRGTLLVLVCLWAVCNFMVVDLFLNVPEFDGIRPRAQLYRAMRYAGHEMVGEPYYDDDFGGAGGAVRLVAVKHEAARRLADELAAVRTMKDPAALRFRAQDAADPRVRIVALRALAQRFGPEAQDTLLAVVRDEQEILKVRKQAARFLGRTGPTVEGDLERLLDSDLPLQVRAGAVLGLGELGSAFAAERLLALAGDETSPFRTVALEAIARISTAEAAPLLRQAALASERRPDTRRAACRALWRVKDPATVQTLCTVLADASTPPEVRAMAADSLGRLGRPDALEIVAAATRDADPQVARKARLAQTRLAHVR